MNNTMFNKYGDIVSVKEIMEMIGFGRAKVLRLLQHNEIKSVKVGMKYIVPRQSVIDYLEKEQNA